MIFPSEKGVTPSGFIQLDARDFDNLGLTPIGKKLVLKTLAEVKLLSPCDSSAVQKKKKCVVN